MTLTETASGEKYMVEMDRREREREGGRERSGRRYGKVGKVGEEKQREMGK